MSFVGCRTAPTGLGATRGKVLATVEHIRSAAAEEPLRIGEAYLLDERVLPSVFIGGLGSDLDERRADLASGEDRNGQ
ncbi:hypothetical protein ACFXPY_21540 [Streptomyces sp. NPDC059153]|uniref:hypothetical protein n=1 Tax=unclassified Streptomyces TaxID=2593676 RepID=UPI0036BF0B5C